MEKYIEKYTLQPICYDQSHESLNKRLYTIEKSISTNLYNGETLAYIISKCYVVDSFGSFYKVVFPYNPKYGFVNNTPFFDEDKKVFINSFLTSTIYDTYEDALDDCYEKNLELLKEKVLKSNEEDYEIAYRTEKIKIEFIRLKLDSLLRETNGLEVGRGRFR